MIIIGDNMHLNKLHIYFKIHLDKPLFQDALKVSLSLTTYSLPILPLLYIDIFPRNNQCLRNSRKEPCAANLNTFNFNTPIDPAV